MKRFLIIMLALSLCFGLFACKEDISESEAESGQMQLKCMADGNQTQTGFDAAAIVAMVK